MFANPFVEFSYPAGWDVEDGKPAVNACLVSIPLMRVSATFSYGLCEEPLNLDDCGRVLFRPAMLCRRGPR